MSDIDQAFERDLAAWRVRYAGRPEQEMVRLCLLSLDREQNVTVAYAESVLGRRLATLSMPDEVGEVVRQALRWVWRDEEMHTIYVRGALLKLARPLLAAHTLLQQLVGAIGGWTVSVRQHRRWSQAPLACAAATLLTRAGGLTGRVPREVQRHLRYCSFRDFCRYNVDTERTAWICWRRLTHLAQQVAALSDGQVDEFNRIAEDEERHRRVFGILADAFTADDRLRPDITVDGLCERIGAIGESFLPRRRRGGATRRKPIGSGAPVFGVERRADDQGAVLQRLLDDIGLRRLLRQRAIARCVGVGALRVALKPSVVFGSHGRTANTGDPALVEQLAMLLRGHGVDDVAVVASADPGERFLAETGVAGIGRHFASSSPHYHLVDSAADQVPHTFARGMAQHTVARAWMDADVRISLASLRRRGSHAAALTLANIEDTGGRQACFSGLARQADRETRLMMLLDEFPPDLALIEVDGRAPDRVPDARARWLYASTDALALDCAVMRHLGLADPRRSKILRAAADWFGIADGAPWVISTRDSPTAGCGHSRGWQSTAESHSR
jgi:uncharacterized protein (DUF362 family)